MRRNRVRTVCASADFELRQNAEQSRKEADDAKQQLTDGKKKNLELEEQLKEQRADSKLGTGIGVVGQ